MHLRRCALAALLSVLVVACGLNPQPEPPSASDTSGNGAGGAGAASASGGRAAFGGQSPTGSPPSATGGAFTGIDPDGQDAGPLFPPQDASGQADGSAPPDVEDAGAGDAGIADAHAD